MINKDVYQFSSIIKTVFNIDCSDLISLELRGLS